MITDFSSIVRPLSSEFPPPLKRRFQADLVQNSTNFIFEYFVLKLFVSYIPVLLTTAPGIHRTHDFFKEPGFVKPRRCSQLCVLSKETHTISPEFASPCSPTQFFHPPRDTLGQRISPGLQTSFSGVSIWRTQADWTWPPGPVQSSRRGLHVENPINRDRQCLAPAHTARFRPLIPPHGPGLSQQEPRPCRH